MRIGIIGAGQMARALGGGWAAAGHEIMIGARSPQRADELATAIGYGARAGTVRDAARFGEVVLLAVPVAALSEVLAEAGDGAWSGRTLIDCTNAFTPDGAAGETLVLAEDAVAERIAAAAPGTHVVKAFNLCAAEVWLSGQQPIVPLCGDDDAVKLVGLLVSDLGSQPAPAGGLHRARYLEATSVLVVGLWFAGVDARKAFPPLEAAFAVPDSA
ncbi:NADP oxidoreductase [Actinoplanes sp. SE50]|uniref:NADPH-dependent F420 reductase n=1 Tax=unclassified Actinoplanes TaxID=2626549 RepID=UPI00023ECB4E|nr:MULTISPECIES: NAD(P)-binding domain-containing protein [unclassified Actinoplanes]AEV85416.1 Glycerol-3-phosphate dehydrogenase [Actinoplanes sp. SE50/110]ATO83811.1 NADP oxidoreductase [Actinoplanes sp. SE50]SLM01219.1 NADP oxidoreductase [Actinoplanes sp. SE50/110]